ncbi:uncharacterized protein LOC126906788 isoform X2 [Daktulosphaira vitifoliae]|uniref:uncharacterized protein LOC126906788 isoform X2 n=1 Tax=Daktulosphaira vitifoliae TaxID=58002 RepID=UPI0021A9C883|nr:uncharacterized protein LOC126906788 isoform X2 [Daktulosphaira vitifoliae]
MILKQNLLIMCENEWSDIKQRFEKEGIDFNRLKADEKLIHVWRWLVDADINLQNARKMIDKLHQKHIEELEDMENYMVHVRVIADKRIDDMEKTTSVLAEQVARLECDLNQLESLNGDNVYDKVSNLILNFKNITNELNLLKKFRVFEEDGKSIDKNEMILMEMIKFSAENESLKQQLKELENQLICYDGCTIYKIEDNSHDTSKELSNVLNKQERNDSLLDNSISWNKNLTNNDTSSISIQLFSDKTKTLNNFENYPFHKSQDINTSQNYCIKEKAKIIGPESTPPSLLSSDKTTPQKLSSLYLDEISLNKLENLRQIQADYEAQKSIASSLGEKYNNLAIKHLHYKSKRKMQIEALRGNLEASHCHMRSLKTQINIQKHRLKTEEEFRKQVETNFRILQNEKRNIDNQFAIAENELRNMARHLGVLQKKVVMLESANAELMSKYLHLVYREHHLTKSTTSDCIVMNVSDSK